MPNELNVKIARIFRELADRLDLAGENKFRVGAYRNAARTVEGLKHPLSALIAKEGELEALPGIGKDLAAKIKEIVQTGRLGKLEELRREKGAPGPDLFEVPDLGPRRIRVLQDALGLRTVAGLRHAAESGRLAGLPGFGPVLQAKLLRHLAPALLLGATRRLSWLDADALARPLLKHLRATPGLGELELAGSYRRHKATVGDLDVLMTASSQAAAVARFLAYPQRAETIAAGNTRAAMRLKDGFQVDLRVVPRESFGAALLYFTGPKEHNVMLRRRALERGLKLNEYGLFKGERRMAGLTEKEVYVALGLDYVSPEKREAGIRWAEAA
jgi:DNA polymerase (family 10)